jgi:hypothetical protein
MADETPWVQVSNAAVDALKFELRDAIAARAVIESRFAPCFAPGSPNAETAKDTENFASREEGAAWLQGNQKPFLTPAFLTDPAWITADRQVKRLHGELAVAMQQLGGWSVDPPANTARMQGSIGTAAPEVSVAGELQTMANSTVLGDLAVQVEKVQDKLHADNKITKLTYKTLDVLAIRGASEIALPDTPAPNLLLLWHSVVRKEDPAFRSQYWGKEGLSLAENEQNVERGSLDDLYQNSATLYRKHESKVLQAEFEKKHRNAAETRTTSNRSELTSHRKVEEHKAEPQSVKSTTARRRQRRPPNVRKELIANLKARHSLALARKICELIDRHVTSTPNSKVALAPLESWLRKAPGTRSWVDVYDHPKTHDLVRSYVNQVPALETRAKSSK